MACGLPSRQYVILVSRLGKKTRHRNPADIVSQPLLLIASYYFVRNSTGADECSIKQAGLAAGIAEVES